MVLCNSIRNGGNERLYYYYSDSLPVYGLEGNQRKLQSQWWIKMRIRRELLEPEKEDEYSHKSFTLTFSILILYIS
jgi:hypothetical protein